MAARASIRKYSLWLATGLALLFSTLPPSAQALEKTVPDIFPLQKLLLDGAYDALEDRLDGYHAAFLAGKESE